MNCPSCGTQLSADARFCHKCGTSTTPPVAPTGWRAGLPWTIAGLALGALLAVLLLRKGSGTPATPVGSAPFAGGAPAIDLSRMSPQEQAQRLFDRVMILEAQGKADSVRFFMPMAIGAYQMLPGMSLDDHFDVGLLQLTAGDPAAALAEADTIRQQVPTHLFAFVLRARALEARGDSVDARPAYRDFLKNETAERARDRQEYQEHRNILDAFHTEALSRTGRATS
jgi:zinc-ribbon domain